MNPTFAAALMFVLRTSVGFKNPTYTLKQLSFDYSSEYQCLCNHNLSDGLSLIPIPKNNLTSLSRLAVLVVLSAARRLVSLLF